MCSSARCALGCPSRCRRTYAMCRLVSGLLAVGEDAAVAQQLLGDPVSRGGARAAQIVSAAHQVAQASCSGDGGATNDSSPARYRRTSFLASRRSVLTRSPARTRTSDGAITSHATPNRPSSRSRSYPHGPASYATASPSGPPSRVDQSPDHALAVIDALHLRRPAARRQRRRDDRMLMHIQRDPQAHIRWRTRANVRHGLTLHSYAAPADTAYLTATTLTPDRRQRRGPARNLGVHPDLTRRSAWPGVRLRGARRCRADGTRRAIRRTNRRVCGRGVRVAAPCVAAAVRGGSGSPRRAAPRSPRPARVHGRRGVDARDAPRPARRSPPCEHRPPAVVRHRHRSARR
jgi:hypothetical protein